MKKGKNRCKKIKPNIDWDIWHVPCWIASIIGSFDSIFKNYSECLSDDRPSYSIPASYTIIRTSFIDRRIKAYEKYCLRTDNRFKQYYLSLVQDGLALIAEHERILSRKSTDLISEERRRWQERSVCQEIIRIATDLLDAEDDLRIMTEYRKTVYEKQFAAYVHGFKAHAKDFRIDTRKNALFSYLSPDVLEKVGKTSFFGSYPIFRYVERSLRVNLFQIRKRLTMREER